MSFILKLSGNSRNWYSNIPRTQTPDSMCYIILDTHKVTELFFDMDEFTILLGQFQPRIGKPGRPRPGYVGEYGDNGNLPFLGDELLQILLQTLHQGGSAGLLPPRSVL